jgi:hypothetical protein
MGTQGTATYTETRGLVRDDGVEYKDRQGRLHPTHVEGTPINPFSSDLSVK